MDSCVVASASVSVTVYLYCFVFYVRVDAKSTAVLFGIILF